MSTTIKRHPDAATLMSFAAASLAEPLAAAVAAHMAICGECQNEMADMQLLGAALLMSSELADSSDRIEVPRSPAFGDGAVPARHPIQANDRLPAPIASAYGLSFDTIPWKLLGPGIWHHRLPLSQGVVGDLRLLKIGPGRVMPDHGHGGSELTLVLDGAYTDQTGEYRCGDMQDVDEEIEHTPTADRQAGCICLIASERPARFKGLVGRLLQPWTGM